MLRSLRAGCISGLRLLPIFRRLPFSAGTALFLQGPPFQIPELTRSGDIKLSRQPSLLPHPHALSLSLRMIAIVRHRGQAVERVFSPLGGVL
jgi:hypothetical protein